MIFQKTTWCFTIKKYLNYQLNGIRGGLLQYIILFSGIRIIHEEVIMKLYQTIKLSKTEWILSVNS